MEKKYSIGMMIKIIDTIFETETNSKLTKLKLTHSQLEILLYIKNQTERNIEVNQIDIERYFKLKNPTVTGILNRLEDKLYIERMTSEKNARFKKIIVTNEAKKILNQGRKQAKIVEEKLTSYLTKEENEELIKILDKIIKNVI